ncbi:hypothetical protein [Brenneria tiliae]|uniref:DUF5667 domain-containing protein n=1 Tax=Brenneria tiliae TaxID=2914984 RepID=A0ABT0MRA6_9GAMM|nr:hypothetical protein [Brenneria tiliae]MCL2891793.1 hypothetical protein [Brenneria tiliae]MCL2898346.1 hypothetical protein [Brenneria tiliae]MCL2902696.1 hypothetical protein [Brenneria tiliae]
MSKLKKNKVSYMATAMAIAMAPVPASTLGYSDIALTHADTRTTLQPLPGSVVYLPIVDATEYLRSMTDRLNFHLKNIRFEWEEKRTPIAMEKQSPFVQKHLERELQKRIAIATKFVDAVRLALNEISDDDLREEVVSFGRAAASLRYTAEDFLSFIDQTHPPKKTSSEMIKASADEVKAMIRAEHKSLGLDIPAFDRVS